MRPIKGGTPSAANTPDVTRVPPSCSAPLPMPVSVRPPGARDAAPKWERLLACSASAWKSASEIAPDRFATLEHYMNGIPASTRSSLLIDLDQGKRIEVEALQGALVRRARTHGIGVPIMETLYALLRNHAGGQRS